MKFNKKWLLGLGSLAVAALLVGCSSGETGGKKAATDFPESTPESLKKKLKSWLFVK